MLLKNKLILSIGGFDPSGCAGILADARMIESLGGQCASLISCHTVQGRRCFHSAESNRLLSLRQQWKEILKSFPIHGVKIGMVTDAAQARWLADELKALNVPIVYDPVLSSSAGPDLGNLPAAKALLALCDLATPNAHEFAQLGVDNHKLPCPMLITRADSDGRAQIKHQLLTKGQSTVLTVDRRPQQYRGTGCLLASAICAQLVAGAELTAACQRALQEVDRWLEHAWRFDDGVHLPRPPAP